MVVRTLDVPLPLHRLDGPTVSFQAGPQTGIGTRFRNVGKLDHASGVGPTDQHGIASICPGMFGDVAEQFADETLTSVAVASPSCVGSVPKRITSPV